MGTTPLTGADSSTPVVAGLSAINTVPVPPSRIVIVPTTPAAFCTVPLVTAPVEILTTSLVSFKVSGLTVVRNNTLVAPTGMVTPLAALTQFVPSKYSIAVPVSLPTEPVPLVSAGVNTTGASATGVLSLTSTTA